MPERCEIGQIQIRCHNFAELDFFLEFLPLLINSGPSLHAIVDLES